MVRPAKYGLSKASCMSLLVLSSHADFNVYYFLEAVVLFLFILPF